MYAVIKTGGKQYRVAQGDVIKVERLAGEVGQTIAFDHVLMVGGDGEGAEPRSARRWSTARRSRPRCWSRPRRPR